MNAKLQMHIFDPGERDVVSPTVDALRENLTPTQQKTRAFQALFYYHGLYFQSEELV